jgi:hypothetical protein
VKTLVLFMSVLLTSALAWSAEKILIVADEFPAMQVLANRLQIEAGWTTEIVRQDEMPASLKDFRVVVVYIHKELSEPAENAFIEYAEAGGKLVALHHSISSGKRANKRWFGFLGVDLKPGDSAQGGYKWIEPVTLTVVSLTNHFITTNKVVWPQQTVFRREAGGAITALPSFTLHDSEVYLNHTPVGPRTQLLGFQYRDANGVEWMQERAGWCKPAGKGWLYYFQPGHSVKDFEDPTFCRVVINAITQPIPDTESM